MFLEPCLQGREPAEHAIDLFFRRYDKAHTPVLERGIRFDDGAVGGGDQEGARPRARRRSCSPPRQAPQTGCAGREAGAARARRSTRSCSACSSRKRAKCSPPSRPNCAKSRAQPQDLRDAHHHPPRLPHAQGQRPHGRPDGPGRSRLGNRAGDEPLDAEEVAGAATACYDLIERGARRVRRLDRAAARRQPAGGDRRAGHRRPRGEAARARRAGSGGVRVGAARCRGGGAIRYSSRRRRFRRRCWSATRAWRRTCSRSTSRRRASTSRRCRSSSRPGAPRRARSRASSCARRTRSRAARNTAGFESIAVAGGGARAVDAVRGAEHRPEGRQARSRRRSKGCTDRAVVRGAARGAGAARRAGERAARADRAPAVAAHAGADRASSPRRNRLPRRPRSGACRRSPAGRRA